MRLLIIAIMLSASIAHAQSTIPELRAEIAQREAAIAVIRAEGKPTGRLEMIVFRLKRELERATLNEEMLNAGSR